MDVTSHLEKYHSVISRTEARALGMSDRKIGYRLTSQQWERVASGVFRLKGARLSGLGRQRAAALTTSGVVSHRAAAAVHQLPGFGLHRCEVTVDYERAPEPRNWMTIHRSKQMALADAHELRGVLVTGLPRTVLDIAGVVRMAQLEEAVDFVLGQNLLTWPDLYEVLARHSAKGRNGCGPLRALLDSRYGDRAIPDSVFNRRVGRLLDDANLGHAMSFEFNIVDGTGTFLARADIAFPNQMVAIECDSVRYHLNGVSFVKDRRRQNRLTTAGWTVLNFTWSDYVDHPAELVNTVYNALARQNAQI